MSAVLEPKRPDPGWVVRWSRLAVDLMGRAAVPLILLALVMNAASFLALRLGLFLRMAGGEILLMLIASRVIATLHVFLVVQIVMDADGHRAAQPTLSLRALRLMAPLMLWEAFMVLVRLAGAVVEPKPILGVEEMIISAMILHGFGLRDILSTVCIMGLFWPVLMVSFGMGFREFYGSLYSRAMGRMGVLLVGMILGGMVFVSAIGSLPAPLMQFVLTFAIAWIYVGAREIFGGITENGARNAPVGILGPAG